MAEDRHGESQISRVEHQPLFREDHRTQWSSSLEAHDVSCSLCENSGLCHILTLTSGQHHFVDTSNADTPFRPQVSQPVGQRPR